MRAMITGLLLTFFAASTFAIDIVELDKRIRTLTSKLEAMQQKPGKAIPAEDLEKARAIVLLDRTKAGLVVAYQGGAGIALVRDRKTDQWSPASFVAANEGSLGIQVGGQRTFTVILLMTTNVASMLTEANVEFGGEAGGAANNSGGKVEATTSSSKNSMLVYVDRKGLFGGAAVKGGAFSPDDDANQLYYQKVVTPQGILFEKQVEATASTLDLIAKLNEYALKK